LSRHDEVLDLKALGLVLVQRERKVIFVLWRSKYGLDKLGTQKSLYLVLELRFPNCEIKLKCKKLIESGANPNSIDMIVPSRDRPFDSHCVDFLCERTESCLAGSSSLTWSPARLLSL
jgi:hypothetical protein